MIIDTSKLDKSEVLAALYNHSRQQGLGFLDSRGSRVLSVDEARHLLNKQTYFDYLYGRVLKIDLSGSELDPWGYDRDNGQGAALRALQPLLTQDQTAA